MHISVLLKEVIKILNPKEGEFFIDGTVGGGGHSVALLEKISSSGILLGVDWNKDAIEKLKAEKFKDCKNVILINSNYADLSEILKKNKLPKADGLIIDLGISSEQLEKSSRGFSFLRDEPLDMRYSGNGVTVAEIINSFSEKDLADIFYKYGEEKYSRQIAKRVIEERRKKRILTTFELVEIIKSTTPRIYEKGRIHPATKVFQALRICVNNELQNLETILKNLENVLKPSGRAAIISFHSLEDRLVKNYFREMKKNGKTEILTKKPIIPTDEEIKENPRSRSAKMRAIKLRL